MNKGTGLYASCTPEELALIREFVVAGPERRAEILAWFEERHPTSRTTEAKTIGL